jgi:hypothetical protein
MDLGARNRVAGPVHHLKTEKLQRQVGTCSATWVRGIELVNPRPEKEEEGERRSKLKARLTLNRRSVKALDVVCAACD